MIVKWLTTQRTNRFRQQCSVTRRAAWPTGLGVDTARCVQLHVCVAAGSGVYVPPQTGKATSHGTLKAQHVFQQSEKQCGFHCSKLHQRIQFILNRMRLLQLCRVASRSSASIQQFSVNAIQDWLWPRRGGTSNLLLVIMPCCHHSYWTGKMTGVSLFIV